MWNRVRLLQDCTREQCLWWQWGNVNRRYKDTRRYKEATATPQDMIDTV